jgi:hypothetical protein
MYLDDHQVARCRQLALLQNDIDRAERIGNPNSYAISARNAAADTKAACATASG